MNGTLPQKNISKGFQINREFVIELLIPTILGMLAITAHARLKLHLGIPGHHGLVFMALMMIVRKTSKIKWSSLLFSAGVGSMLYIPFLGFEDPFAVFVYLWPGIIFDLFYVPNVTKQTKTWYIAIIAGLAYSTIPVSRFILGIFTGIVHKSVLQGLSIPFLVFFAFGLLGSLIGIGIIGLLKKPNT
jgi:hypothetical protein